MSDAKLKDEHRSYVVSNWNQVSSMPSEVMELLLSVSSDDWYQTGQNCIVNVPIVVPYDLDPFFDVMVELWSKYDLTPYDAIAYNDAILSANTKRSSQCSMLTDNGIVHQFSRGCVVIFYEFVYNKRKYKFGVLVYRSAPAAKSIMKCWNISETAEELIKPFINECTERYRPKE